MGAPGAHIIDTKAYQEKSDADFKVPTYDNFCFDFIDPETGKFYPGMSTGSPLGAIEDPAKGGIMGAGVREIEHENAVRVLYTYTKFIEEFPKAMQAVHNGVLMNENRWNETFAKLKVAKKYLKYHPDFMVQFNATEVDDSATQRARLWRNPEQNMSHKIVEQNYKGSRPILDAVWFAVEEMRISSKAVTASEGWRAWTVRYALKREEGERADWAGTGKIVHPAMVLGTDPAGYRANIEARHAQQEKEGVGVKDLAKGMSEEIYGGFARKGKPTPIYELMSCNKKETLLDYAMKAYQEWIYWRALYIQQEDNVHDQIDYNAVRKCMGKDEPTKQDKSTCLDKLTKAVDDQRQKNFDEAAVRRDIALGLVQKASFREQCFLLSKIFPLVAYKKDTLDATQGKRLPYVHGNEFYEPPLPRGGVPFVWQTPYPGNACLQVDGSSFGFMNLMTTDPAIFPFFQAHHSQLSMLQPMMRFFKVTEKIVDGEEKLSEKEINFDAFERNFPLPFSPQQMLMSSTQRGMGAGVKSFNFTYDGSNPFAAKKSIKAKLVIFANSFDELMKCRGNCKSADASQGYRYIDLALKTGGPRIGQTEGSTSGRASGQTGEDPLACIPTNSGLPDDHQQQNTTTNEDPLDKLNFRLKAVVGYAPPPNLSGRNPEQTDLEFYGIENRGNRIGNLAAAFQGTTATQRYNSIRAAVDSSFVTLNLTPTTHDFKFDEMGRVTFTINYLAYVEDFFDQRHFNIFSNLEIAKFMLIRRMRFDKLKKVCNNEEINDLKEKEKNEVGQNKLSNLKSLTQNLFNTGRVQFYNISYDQLKTWESEGPYANMESSVNIRSSSPKAADEIAARIEQDVNIQLAGDAAQTALDDAGHTRLFSKFIMDTNAQAIPFFYVGDLLDTILEGIDAYLSENGMQNMIDQINAPDTPAANRIAEITECDKEYEKYKLRKFADEFKRFRAVLGPVEIVNPINVSDSQFVNLGDLPISIKYFNEWLTSKLLKKDRAVYTLPRFLNDFFNHLIRNFLNNDTCFNYNIKQKIKLNQAAVTDYTSRDAAEFKAAGQFEGMDTLTFHTFLANWRRRQGGGTALYKPIKLVPLGTANIPTQDGGYGGHGELMAPLLNISGPNPGDPRHVAASLEDAGGIDRETNYMIYYAGRMRPTELMTGNIIKDARNGIMHFNHGQDVGIVKKVELNKTSSPGLAEVRFEQDGWDGQDGLEQLRVMYDATISTFCLPNVFPGQYLYVDPRSFSPSEGSNYGKKYDLTSFGIGGYFMAYKIEHRLGVGEAETTIHAKWVAEVTKDDGKSGTEFGEGSDDSVPGSDDIDSRDPATIGKCQEARLERHGNALQGVKEIQAAAAQGDNVGEAGMWETWSSWITFV
jgi:hypothetical protein